MTEDERSDDKTGIDRRTVLRTVGTAGVLATGTAGVAAAGSQFSRAEETRLLTGEEKRELARELSETEAFRELAQQAREDGNLIRNEADGVTAGYATGEGFTREIVEYELKGLSDAERGSIVVGRDPTTDEIEVASLDYYYETDDGVLDEVHRTESADAAGSEQLETATADSAGGTTVISVDTAAIRRVQDGSTELDESGAGGTANGTVTTQIDVTGCDACKIVAGQVCNVGCGATGGFICGFLGITVPVAGLSCLGLVEIICTVADEYSGCGDAVAEEACDRADLC
ncbi:halocin C8 precursor [Natrinema pellirubrum DSM 15624]|nr:halocin C8 precursor [Natrinema pellirubrum DSM 15624]